MSEDPKQVCLTHCAAWPCGFDDPLHPCVSSFHSADIQRVKRLRIRHLERLRERGIQKSSD